MESFDEFSFDNFEELNYEYSDEEETDEEIESRLESPDSLYYCRNSPETIHIDDDGYLPPTKLRREFIIFDKVQSNPCVRRKWRLHMSGHFKRWRLRSLDYCFLPYRPGSKSQQTKCATEPINVKSEEVDSVEDISVVVNNDLCSIDKKPSLNYKSLKAACEDLQWPLHTERKVPEPTTISIISQ